MKQEIGSIWVLGREEVYEASPRIWAFKYVDDIVNGINLCLSNMVGGFPFEFAGQRWSDSERLYLCGEFSSDTEEHNRIQQALIAAKSGYAAKRFVKTPNKRLVREDFTEFRLQWMLYCVWQKCKGNKAFRDLLMQIPDEAILIENTTTDNQGSAEIWGCRNKELVAARDVLAAQLTEINAHLTKKALRQLVNIETNKLSSLGQWKGQNNIGKVLMICRQAIKQGEAPVIDYDLLRKARIHILGRILTFEAAE